MPVEVAGCMFVCAQVRLQKLQRILTWKSGSREQFRGVIWLLWSMRPLLAGLTFSSAPHTACRWVSTYLWVLVCLRVGCHVKKDLKDIRTSVLFSLHFITWLNVFKVISKENLLCSFPHSDIEVIIIKIKSDDLHVSETCAFQALKRTTRLDETHVLSRFLLQGIFWEFSCSYTRPWISNEPVWRV